MPKRDTGYIERALFIIGEPDAGKSAQIRSMFRDWRFGTGGSIPTARNLANHYPLSNERWLYLRISSPHESQESPKDFLRKCEQQMQKYEDSSRRWCFAGALQPYAANKMPDAAACISDFIKRFGPERVRAVILYPNRHGTFYPDSDLTTLVQSLQALPQTEVILTDARSKDGNGLIYADFFDFT